jgi:hypothetical protein
MDVLARGLRHHDADERHEDDRHEPAPPFTGPGPRPPPPRLHDGQRIIDPQADRGQTELVGVEAGEPRQSTEDDS